MANNNHDRTIKCALHIDDLGKVDRYLRLAHRNLEQAVTALRADYAEQGRDTGTAMTEVCYVLSTLSNLNDGWVNTKRGLYIEASHDLLSGAPMHKPVTPTKVTHLRNRSSASSLLTAAADAVADESCAARK